MTNLFLQNIATPRSHDCIARCVAREKKKKSDQHGVNHSFASY